ncbi:hypothetical protein [Aquabacterium sp.]|uniref:hypothetical protein n=1 Tax=Aquabacterium sp. TaxID=1872578 RepID=UPI002B98F6A8|nr:hypothetical protein [Aquabacterium sp.]HSW05262.1 hypothetical protein [Aquabacterium sp.]
MKDFEHSTLWRISAFERLRETDPDSHPMMLPTTLLADLDHLQRDPANDDVLEVIAACLRHHEPALLYLAFGAHVWPISLFPTQWLYHARHEPSTLGPESELAHLRLINAERPGVRPPGHWMFERVAATQDYRQLRPLLWTLALHGPRRMLLTEIGGRAAYRVTSTGASERPAASGALGPAMQHLRQDAASLHDMQHWPGMSLERASRLLNGLYLTGGLMVTRSHPAARDEPHPPRPVIRRH